ncbi:MOSC domain-containing protein [Cochlodiniinecator piscidefendens]|uniref:MOSC domain-containing protein n=1 Tax=Cochlodiniinecator piscidefendens TaxID=2715756 RepID=UPI00140E4716|nr:sulfurase [Cochlodiniinecator piscidefendens]
MPVFEKTEFIGEIVWLGYVPDREQSLRSIAVDRLKVAFSGPLGEAHGGLTRPSCGRVRDFYPLGTEIRNTRQLSVLSAEELSQVASVMGVPKLQPEDLGASLILSGLPDLTHLPPSARLQTESGVTLVVDVENAPCHLPAKYIDESHEGKGRSFKSSAVGRRGITAWIEAEGVLELGERVNLFVPTQRAWQSR